MDSFVFLIERCTVPDSLKVEHAIAQLENFVESFGDVMSAQPHCVGEHTLDECEIVGLPILLLVAGGKETNPKPEGERGYDLACPKRRLMRCLPHGIGELFESSRI